MKRDVFCRYLHAYGAQIDKWPPSARALARTLVQTDPEFAALLQAEAAFEQNLKAGDEAIAAPDHMAERVAALSFQYSQLPSPARPRALGVLDAARWFIRECGVPKPALTLTALAAIGLVAGFVLFSQTGASDVPEALLQTFFGTSTVVL